MRMFRGYMMLAVILAASAISVQAQTPVRIVDSADPAAYISAANPLQVVTGTPASSAGGHLRLTFNSTASINANVAKASAGRIYGWEITNNTTTWRYCRIYNKATAPVPASDSALILTRIGVPPNGVSDAYVMYGIAGASSGISIACTSGAADTDATALIAADEMMVNILYN